MDLRKVRKVADLVNPPDLLGHSRDLFPLSHLPLLRPHLSSDPWDGKFSKHTPDATTGLIGPFPIPYAPVRPYPSFTNTILRSGERSRRPKVWVDVLFPGPRLVPRSLLRRRSRSRTLKSSVSTLVSGDPRDFWYGPLSLLGPLGRSRRKETLVPKS